jgi:hypothetical protein
LRVAERRTSYTTAPVRSCGIATGGGGWDEEDHAANKVQQPRKGGVRDAGGGGWLQAMLQGKGFSAAKGNYTDSWGFDHGQTHTPIPPSPA